MPRGERIYNKVRTSDLCRLFNCSTQTLMRWIRQGRLDPTKLEDIIEKYNNRGMLDRRTLRIHSIE
jgi:predicted site-specific integrase-resolvase